MSQHSHRHTWDPWSGWSTISASTDSSFTIWFTGLPGTGKMTLAHLVKKTLVGRGYKVEIIDSHALSYWLKHELHIEDDIREDRSHAPGYEAFTTYICTLLARNGIITITASVSPYQEVRTHALEQIQHFIKVYLHCSSDLRRKRLQQQELPPGIAEHMYQPSTRPELSINTGLEVPERSALHVLTYLEHCGHIAPRWEENDTSDEEIATVKVRLQALGYLE